MTREDYVQDFVQEDEILLRIKERIAERNMPTISVPPELGKLLTLLVKSSGATRVLEIGVLGGYSGICLARGLPDGGKLISLELNPEWAEFAKSNVTEAGLGDKVEYMIGTAADSLERLVQEQAKFDLFFIDADKPNYPLYLERAMELANRGALIIADNVLLGDRVLNPNNHDPSPAAVKAFNQTLKTDHRLLSTLLPVRDGFAIAYVK